MNAQFLSKDAIKEALATCIENPIDISAPGGIAMDTVWALACAIPATVVIDSWWFKPRDLAWAKAGIETASADRIAEVWCEVPVHVARDRYKNRQRDALYKDTQRLASDWDTWAEHASPLGLAPTVLVDTTRPVNCADLAQYIEHAATPPQK
ncbi:hypothetical protein [Nocardia neocaledoniensis]|uniref:hypothetical protein n=1 Tax=Nocardia neocaledoniensis TaxID=236511 RepID=UPI00245592B2|nr:hypothetical protein [Nocardia neocaledoniensis]